MASLVEQLAQHIDREIARDLKDNTTRMAYEEFSEFLKNTVGFAHDLYYKVPNVELEMDLVRVSNAKELYYMFDVANAYGWLEMYVDHHDMKLSQYLDNVADTIIMDGVVSKWRGPPKTKHCNKFSVYDLVNCAENEVERATQDEAVQGEDNQQQQQDNPVEHDNPETAIYVEIQSRKGTVENSFTLSSTKEVENVKIMRSCNGLLLCTGLGWPACNFVYNPSTNLFKMLLSPDYSQADL
ncbi:hypothetical protein Tco_0217287 [Tanacetum coccineum]